MLYLASGGDSGCWMTRRSLPVDGVSGTPQAHRIAHDLEHELVHSVPRLAAATVHTEPVSAAETGHDVLAHHR